MYIDEIEKYLLNSAQKFDSSVKHLLFTEEEYKKVVLIVIIREGKDDLHVRVNFYRINKELLTMYIDAIRDALLSTLPYMDRKVRMMNL